MRARKEGSTSRRFHQGNASYSAGGVAEASVGGCRSAEGRRGGGGGGVVEAVEKGGKERKGRLDRRGGGGEGGKRDAMGKAWE